MSLNYCCNSCGNVVHENSLTKLENGFICNWCKYEEARPENKWRKKYTKLEEEYMELQKNFNILGDNHMELISKFKKLRKKLDEIEEVSTALGWSEWE